MERPPLKNKTINEKNRHIAIKRGGLYLPLANRDLQKAHCRWDKKRTLIAVLGTRFDSSSFRHADWSAVCGRSTLHWVIRSIQRKRARTDPAI